MFFPSCSVCSNPTHFIKNQLKHKIDSTYMLCPCFHKHQLALCVWKGITDCRMLRTLLKKEIKMKNLVDNISVLLKESLEEFNTVHSK